MNSDLLTLAPGVLGSSNSQAVLKPQSISSTQAVYNEKGRRKTALYLLL